MHVIVPQRYKVSLVMLSGAKHLKFLLCIFLDFLEITVYTSNNLETVDKCSTLW
jgi:hypothetical protein